jgi:hypothetical protein
MALEQKYINDYAIIIKYQHRNVNFMPLWIYVLYIDLV